MLSITSKVNSYPEGPTHHLHNHPIIPFYRHQTRGSERGSFTQQHTASLKAYSSESWAGTYRPALGSKTSAIETDATVGKLAGNQMKGLSVGTLKLCEEHRAREGGPVTPLVLMVT